MLPTIIAMILQSPVFASVVLSLLLGAVFVAVVAVRDVFLQNTHAIQHNFPVVGHLRYVFEEIGPELRQYWVANDGEELPFNRNERSWVYASAKGQTNTFGFGTEEQVYGIGYPIIKHRVFPYPDTDAEYAQGDPTCVPSLKVMGATHNRRRPYRPMSVVNVSAMSYGSLGRNAVIAINRGVAGAGAFQNTGEGGVSPYHDNGADLIWQLGTGYFGARKPDGGFDLDKCVAVCERYPTIRGIEVKLSQGAKPGKGGILPGKKVTAEIAEIRGVEAGQTVHSPNAHPEFSDVDGLIDFVERIAEATGLPVGVKSAVGELEFWVELADRMKARNEGPDWIQIDGGEGGTGAAPLTFADHVALPFKIGFARVYRIFQERDMSRQVVWIGSGKLGFPDRAVVGFAMGCDLISVAREAMLAIGCIQAQQCHTDYCPAGVATHNSWLQGGLDPDVKALRLTRYMKTFRKELVSLAHAAGYQHPAQFQLADVEVSTGINEFTALNDVMGYDRDPCGFVSMKELEPLP